VNQATPQDRRAGAQHRSRGTICPMPGDDDVDLVARTLAGERSAFDALVARYLVRMRALARAVLGPGQAADDAVQEAFLRAFRQLGELGDGARFAPWLSRIVHREALRLASARPVVPLATDPPAPALVDADPRVAVVRRHLEGLDAASRTVLRLRYEAGQSVLAIAATLGISEAAAEKRLQRARTALAARVQADPDLHST
jgi:RNA polymerase sigma-70 factor, ECF subfamily